MRRLMTIALVMAIGVAACGDDGPARDDDGQVTERQTVSIFSLQAGDCFEDPNAAVTDQIEEITVVPCSEPHDNEAFFSFELGDGAFPGDDAMFAQAADRCIPAFESFVGFPFEDSQYDVFPISPTETSWDAGDRTILCVLFNLDLTPMTGSARGSAR